MPKESSKSPEVLVVKLACEKPWGSENWVIGPVETADDPENERACTVGTGATSSSVVIGLIVVGGCIHGGGRRVAAAVPDVLEDAPHAVGEKVGC